MTTLGAGMSLLMGVAGLVELILHDFADLADWVFWFLFVGFFLCSTSFIYYLGTRRARLWQRTGKEFLRQILISIGLLLATPVAIGLAIMVF